MAARADGRAVGFRYVAALKWLSATLRLCKRYQVISYTNSASIWRKGKETISAMAASTPLRRCASARHLPSSYNDRPTHNRSFPDRRVP